jgi:hypothetical protein
MEAILLRGAHIERDAHLGWDAGSVLRCGMVAQAIVVETMHLEQLGNVFFKSFAGAAMNEHHLPNSAACTQK